MSLIYVVTVNGQPTYASKSEASANEEAALNGGVVTQVYLFGGV
ncbi:hypothetical protein [Rheinheimera sp. MMS21-TC3]|nr:hypothetical protein [Rheinheimera sp. MMS21-TC3]WNO60855.1 hypothetical protein RDV63_07800 [Rheinheimera sp. MMS21-TC3]